MVQGIFGVPGCGKSTYMAMIAQKELRRIAKGKSKYDHVLTNFQVHGCEKVEVYDLGRYDLENCLILLDEITLDADSRDYKTFSAALKEFFVLHRHVNCDIIYFMQDPSRCDKTIRNLTFSLWYMYTPVLPFFRRFSILKRIYRNININEFTSELTLGYRFAKFVEIVFQSSKKICYRPRWYQYFDSYDKCQLSNLPVYDYKKW